MENQKTDSITIVNKDVKDIRELALATPQRIVVVYDGKEYEAYIYSAGVTMELANVAVSLAVKHLSGNHFYFDYTGVPVLFSSAEDSLMDICASLTALWFDETHEKHGDYGRMFAKHFSSDTDYWPYLHLKFSETDNALSAIV
jgi:hypothetical protein